MYFYFPNITKAWWGMYLCTWFQVLVYLCCIHTWVNYWFNQRWQYFLLISQCCCIFSLVHTWIVYKKSNTFWLCIYLVLYNVTICMKLSFSVHWFWRNHRHTKIRNDCFQFFLCQSIMINYNKRAFFRNLYFVISSNSNYMSSKNKCVIKRFVYFSIGD